QAGRRQGGQLSFEQRRPAQNRAECAALGGQVGHDGQEPLTVCRHVVLTDSPCSTNSTCGLPGSIAVPLTTISTAISRSRAAPPMKYSSLPCLRQCGSPPPSREICRRAWLSRSGWT